MLRIGYVVTEKISTDGTSGAAAHIREISGFLINAGFDVQFVQSSEPCDNASGQPSETGNRIVSHSKLKAWIPEAIRLGVRNGRERRNSVLLHYRERKTFRDFDVIYERDSFQNFSTSRFAKRYDLPHIIECNGIFWGGDGSPFHVPVFQNLYKRKHLKKWRRAQHIIVVSEYFRSMMVEEGLDEDKITVCHNGVNLEPYDKVSDTDVRQLRTRLGISEGEVVVGFLGHLQPRHRADVLLRAIARLKRSEIAVRGLFVGGGQWEDFKRFAREIGIPHRCIFTGPIAYNQVPVYTKCMDIGVLPGSPPYASPVKLFDYGAARCTVVAVDVPCTREIVEPEETGLLFTPGDDEDLAVQITNVIKKPGLAKQRAEKLYERVKSNHTWAQVGLKTYEIICEVHAQYMYNRR